MHLQTQPAEGQTQFLPPNPSIKSVGAIGATGPVFQRIWPRAIIAFGLGLTVAWTCLLGYALIFLIGRAY